MTASTVCHAEYFKMRLLLLILMWAVTLPSLAQDDTFKQAEGNFAANDFYEAIPLYRRMVQSNPAHVQSWYGLAESYYYSRDHGRAVEAYNKLIRLIADDKGMVKSYYLVYYHYGNSLMALGQYDEAKNAFLQFMKLRVKADDIARLKKLANYKIKSCKSVDKFYGNELIDYTTERLPAEINGVYSEFAPVWMDNHTLLYTTIKEDTIVISTDEERFGVTNKIYRATRDIAWEESEEMAVFNHPYRHTANGAFSSDKKMFAYTICQENKGHEVRCQVYVSVKSNKGWGEPRKLKNKINVKGATNTQPAFGTIKKRGKSTEVLYFVSDRPGGKGGLDLWYTTKDKKGTWNSPRNCGPAVNTPGNEITPYYDEETELLYFSSDTHEGLGGYDVFSTKGNTRSWQRPQNMGAGINTGFDDTYFSWRVAGQDATLVSNRPGSVSVFGDNCCDDIYFVSRHQRHRLPGFVVTADSMPLDAAEVEISYTENNAPDSLSASFVTAADGAFVIDYLEPAVFNIAVSKTGYETTIINLSSVDKTFPDTLYISLQEKLKELETKTDIELLEPQALSAEKLADDISTGTVLVMNNVYFNFGETTLQQSAYNELDVLVTYLQTNSRVTIEIGGHTDSKGDAQHNLKLSQSRADAIKDYLVSHGVSQERLRAVGYGEEKPIAANTYEDGRDNPEGRQLNRRTEIVILSK